MRPADRLLPAGGLAAVHRRPARRATTGSTTRSGCSACYITLAAIAGNLVGYWIGAKVGPPLFSRENSRFFKQQYVDQTKAFFDKYGARAIVLARFVPIVRTFITAMAGASRMDFRAYALYSTIGGILWGVGVTVLGYLLGNVPFVRENIEFILIGIVALSVIPIAFEVLRARRESAREAAAGPERMRRGTRGPAVDRSEAPRSTMTATATTSAPASRSASTAVSTDPPVVDVSSTASTRRPATSGPSIRRCRPCALPSLRTTNASSRRPVAAAACSIAVATGSAPSVSPPTAT